jgi:hypothetical protein
MFYFMKIISDSEAEIISFHQIKQNIYDKSEKIDKEVILKKMNINLSLHFNFPAF